jgi:ATP-binding cassette subfamily C protein
MTDALKPNSARTLAMLKNLWFVNPPRMAAMLACLLAAGLAEGVGFITLLPILGIATGQGVSGDSRLGRAIASAFDTIGIEPRLWFLLLVVVVAVLVKAGLVLLAQRNVGYAAADFATELRLSLIQNLMTARWSHFVTQASGGLANAIGIEASQTGATYSSLANLLANAMQAAVISALALLASWQVTTVGLIAGAIMIIVLQRLVALARAAGGRQIRLMKSLITRLMDGLQLIKPLKAMGLESRLRPLLESEARGIKTQRHLTDSIAALSAFQEPILVLFLAGGAFVALTYTTYPLADLLFMAILFQRIVARTGGLQVQYQKVVSFEGAYWSLRGTIDRAAAARENISEGGARPGLDQMLRVENVSFAYDGHSVLQNVTLEVPARRVTAIIGESGAGKTTLADLVIGLIRPGSGRITVDGVPLESLDQHAWRQAIGYVPQESVLLHDTIAANVTLGDPEISRADAETALRAAGATDFVAAMPDGVNTVVGERGARLSGGQRQRVAIARALARKPKLLILDEPTTALDPETERGICRTIRELSRHTTVLAISHQTAIMDAADVVYRIFGGAVVAEDRPAHRHPAGILRQQER